MKRFSGFIALGLILAMASACDSSKEFAKMTDRVAGYVSTGIDIAEKDLDKGSNAQVQTLGTLRAINTINGELIVESKKYLSADGKKFALTGNGKQDLLKVLGSGHKTLQSLLGNEDFLKIEAGKRKAIERTINDLTETFAVMVELVNAVKTK